MTAGSAGSKLKRKSRFAVDIKRSDDARRTSKSFYILLLFKFQLYSLLLLYLYFKKTKGAMLS